MITEKRIQEIKNKIVYRKVVFDLKVMLNPAKRIVSSLLLATVMTGAFVFIPTVGAEVIVSRELVLKVGEANTFTNNRLFGYEQDGTTRNLEWSDHAFFSNPWGGVEQDSSGGTSDMLGMLVHVNFWDRARALLRFDLSFLNGQLEASDIGDTHYLTFIIQGNNYNNPLQLYKISGIDGTWVSSENTSNYDNNAYPTGIARVRGAQHTGGGGAGEIRWSEGEQLGPKYSNGTYTPISEASISKIDGVDVVRFPIKKADLLSWINGTDKNGLLIKHKVDSTGGSGGLSAWGGPAYYQGTMVYSSNATFSARPTLTINYNSKLSNTVVYDEFKYFNHANTQINKLTNAYKSVTASIHVQNETEVKQDFCMILGLYGGNGKLRALNIAHPSVEAVENDDITVTLNLANIDISDGDYLKAFLWDDIQTLSPLPPNLKTVAKAPVASSYLTGNLMNYRSNINISDEDTWSYFGFNGKYLNSGPFVPFLLKNGVVAGNWLTDIGRTDKWLVKPDGDIVSDPGKGIIWNYTIGEETAGFDLLVTAEFSGRDGTTLAVIKTNDDDISTLNTDDIKSNILYEQNGPGAFKLVIPADDTKIGNDILFVVDFDIGGTNKLNVTIDRINE